MALLSAATAFAQDDDNRDLSLRLYEEAAEDYRAGRFERAATKLQTAYDLFPEPVLLYNLGRALEGSGDLEGAQDAYQQFLREAPEDAEERPATEARLESIDGLLAAMAPQPAEPDPEPQPVAAAEPRAEPVEVPRPSYALPIALVASGAALAAGGLVFQLRAGSLNDDANDPATSQREVSALNDEARNNAIGAAALFAAGGALVGTGIVFFILRKNARAQLSVGPTGISVRGQF